MKLFKGTKRQDAKNPAEEEVETTAAAAPPANTAGKKKDPVASPGDNDDPQAAAPAKDDEGDENDDDNEDDNDDDMDPEDKKKSGKSKASSEAARIADLCAIAGRSHLAAGFLRKGLSAQAVQRHLVKLKNEDAEANLAAGETVSTAHSGGRTKPPRLVEGMTELLKQQGLLQ